MWLILTMNGMRWAYLRLTAPSTPKVVATALQPPSIASSTMLAGSKYIGFGANDAAAECSMPWSTGQDRQVAGVRQAAVAVELTETAQHCRRSVGHGQRPIEKIGTGEHQLLAGHTGAHMVQQHLGVGAEQGGHVHDTPRKLAHDPSWVGTHHVVVPRL